MLLKYNTIDGWGNDTSLNRIAGIAIKLDIISERCVNYYQK